MERASLSKSPPFTELRSKLFKVNPFRSDKQFPVTGPWSGKSVDLIAQT